MLLSRGSGVQSVSVCWQVNRAAEECATTLARAIPAEQCVSILNPFIETHDFPFNLAAIKMQIKVIESAQDKDIVRSLLPTLIPRLLKVCYTETVALDGNDVETCCDVT